MGNRFDFDSLTVNFRIRDLQLFPSEELLSYRNFDEETPRRIRVVEVLFVWFFLKDPVVCCDFNCATYTGNVGSRCQKMLIAQPGN